MKSNVLSAPFYAVSGLLVIVLAWCEGSDVIRADQLPEMRQVIGVAVIALAFFLTGKAIDRALKAKEKATWPLGRLMGRNF